MENNLPKQGMMIYKNMDIFEGEFVNGDVYEGDWKDDKGEGNGKQPFVDNGRV